MAADEMDRQDGVRRPTCERVLAWALAAGALMSGLNALIQVSRLVLQALRGGV